MADLRAKIYGLAGALLCAGMAYAGPATCAAPTATTSIVRAEGTTEQLAQLTFVCTVTTGGLAGGLGFSGQVFFSPALPVTSKAFSATGNTEALLTITAASAGGAALAGAAVVNVQGTVSGSTINFNTTLPAPTGPYVATDTLTFVISNVRVNATSLSVGSGVPPSIAETVFVSGAGVVPTALASTTVGFAQNGLGANKLVNGTGTTYPASVLTSAGISTTTTNSVANNFVICNANTIATAFVVQIKENFAQAFKDGNGSPAATGGSGIGPGSERSQIEVLPSAGATNLVAPGTRVNVNFSNVPANATLYVPTGAFTSSVGTALLQVTSAAAGSGFSQSGITASTLSGIVAAGFTGATAVTPVTISGGAGTATFEITRSDVANLDTFYVPVFVGNTANSIPGSATAIGVTVSLAPVGSTAIPNFAVGSSTVTLTGSAFNLCTTSMLFPFVTNQLGFDTGIAISNTSTDPFGTKGATAQAGTCTLNFYGAGAPTPNNVTTPNVPSGTTYTTVLSSVAAGFQGYAIVQCQFQFAHSFVFVTNGVGPNGGLSQGYIGMIIPDTNQKTRAADPLSAGGLGSGENLGQ